MVDPISSNPVGPIGPLAPGSAMRPSAGPDSGSNFAAMLRQQLERVSDMQNEAEQGIQDLLTGRTQNITEVFATARKAEVAFSLLMELRNKLTDAYTELKQMRV
ncbi:MAG: flagellar hook-basal body complex protein FliE [Planctomycetota bacterium]